MKGAAAQREWQTLCVLGVEGRRGGRGVLSHCRMKLGGCSALAVLSQARRLGTEPVRVASGLACKGLALTPFDGVH